MIVPHPTIPPIARTAWSDRVLQVHPFPALPPPTRPAPARCLRGRPSSVLRPDQSLHLSTGEPPATSWIVPARHFHTALVSIKPSVDLRVHYVVHLSQDGFLHRSSGRLRVGKAAKVVAPVPSSETKCYAPAERCGVAQYLGRERRVSPNKRLHNRPAGRTKSPWLHCRGVGPLQDN